MAKVVVFYKFAEGAILQTIVEGKTSYPDALAQMRHEAIRAFSEAMAAAYAETALPEVVMPTLLEDET